MGHKKRKAAPRSKPSQPAAAASSNGAAAIVDCGDSVLENSAESINGTSAKLESSISVSNGNVASSPLYASVKLEYEKALVAFRRGNHTKALRLMKDLWCKHENSPLSALIHRVQGTLCVKVASTISDPNVKQRHMKSAIESARKAASLSPSLVEFAHFYANLLCDAANDAKEYEEVVQECERALAIENPVDPATENLQEKKEKFRFIPIRSAPEDPMELRLVQAKRPTEIKKVAKTEEERRKEVEVRVAAARLMQQQSESPHLGNGGDNNANNSKDSVLGSGQRVGERRKSGNMRKSASSDERMDLVKSYWKTLSSEGKKDLLTVKISDLMAHFSSLKDCTFSEVLNEALSFGEANKIWKFWVCCRCNEKFADAMDSNVAIRMLEKQLKSDTHDLLEESSCKHNADDSNECYLDTYCNEYEGDSSPGKKTSSEYCNGSKQDIRKFEDVEWMGCNDLPSISYVSGTPITSHLSYDNGVILDSDAFLSWIFTCASASEQLASWKCATAEKAQQGLEILQLLEKESFHLQDLCERKCEQLNFEEALQALEDMCLEEGRKRENTVGFVCQSYEYVLKKRREELIEDGCGITLISNRFELEAIANVLKDTESLNMNH
ncbi:hypothetical protein SASPL_155016 [Salvia splendens]|uniref:Uncharacterized protein n=1 Tax=Salvia splendens TaxID=180675 RepID=A0A8X8W148_SALSN|nr:hypothetical protein SASPL_155016 [Salvia splendens]